MKNNIASLLFLVAALSAFGAGGLKNKSAFAQKEIFQSGYFLKNVPGLVTGLKDENIDYFADHDGICVFFTKDGLIYKVTGKDEKKAREQEQETKRELKEHEQEKGPEKNGLPTLISYTFLKWAGSNPDARIEAEGEGRGYYTFLAGSRDADLHSMVTHGFSKIIYRDLYPGIDVEYSFPDKGGMEYNLIVHPGADVSRVRMEYSGAVKKIGQDKSGNLLIHTSTGDISENAPVSFTAATGSVASAFSVYGKSISFRLPAGYDHNQTLTIDPWVHALTTLSIREMGISADYDAAGNLYVYGAGASTEQDTSYLQKVVKYDINGNLIWTFMGSVPGVWTTWGLGINNSGYYNNLSNAKVDKVTNKIYVGKGFSYYGTQMIRLTSAGLYDNFISVLDSNVNEIWSFVADCATGDVLSMGGGTTHYFSMGVINPVTGVVASNNITGDLTDHNQDVVSAAYDPSGNLYMVMVDPFTSALNNHIFKINSTYNGYVWDVYSGHNSFTEHLNMPAFYEYGSTSNFNALAINSSYLYLYDGKYLKAFTLNNGAAVGTPAVIPGYDTTYQGGIAVDNCNNIYVGGLGVIKTFTFNGTVFTPQADIPLGAGFSTDTVYDVRYNPTNNLLYVTGTRIAGTYTATLSGSCSVVVDSFTSAVTAGCNQAIVQVTPVGLTNPQFSYLWEDTAGNILRQTSPGASLYDTLTGLSGGQFTVQVQLNINCGGSSQTDTFNISTTGCNSLTVSHDTTVCTAQPVTLYANGTPGGGTYNWTGGNTTPSITVAPTSSTTYYVTYTPPIGTGSPVTDSIRITVVNTPIVSLGNDTAICSGQVVLNAGNPGANYVWNTNATTQTITVSSIGAYSVTVTYNASCSASASISITSGTLPPVTVTSNKPMMCSGDSAYICAPAGYTGYYWSTGDTSTCIYTTNAGNYYVTVTNNYHCTATSNQVNVAIYQPTPVTISINGDTLSSYNAVAYQWYYNGQVISGDTSRVIIAAQTGIYVVQITDNNGCDYSSNPTAITVSGIKNVVANDNLMVYPNPLSGGSWYINAGIKWLGAQMEIFDVNGQVIYKGLLNNTTCEIPLHVSSGVYLLQVENESRSVCLKLIKL